MTRFDEDRRQATRKVTPAEIDHVAGTIMSEFPEVQAVWLFGSYARGEERRSSDVDLAAMTSPDLAEDYGHRWLLRRRVEDLLGVPADVVLLSALRPPALLWEILSRPRLLAARDPEDAAAFASGLRAMVREDWPRLERAWERARQRILEWSDATIADTGSSAPHGTDPRRF